MTTHQDKARERSRRFDVSDQEMVDAFEHIYEQATLALSRGITHTTLTFETKSFLALMDEIKDRRPRNISMLLTDTRLTRMDELLDRLREEVTYMIANGPSGLVAERFDANRPSPIRRTKVSKSLAENIRSYRVPE